MKRIVHLLNDSLHAMMNKHDNVVVLGEDILDPYGGAFKVTQGLSTSFPGRVITTPISEAGFVGVGIGLALSGWRPVVEIMFGDFITLISDQLINHASKMTWMYNQEVQIPIVIRTPMGGRRGYGPTHSQSLERLFMGIPGLTVLASSPFYDPGKLLSSAIEGTTNPVLFIESKQQYASALVTVEELREANMSMNLTPEKYPSSIIAHPGDPDITIISSGAMSRLALEAAILLHRDEGLNFEIIIVHQMSPIDMTPIIESVKKTRRSVVLEEGIVHWGWGSEIVANISQVEHESPPVRVGAKPFPIAASRAIEDKILPQVADVMAAVVRTVDSSYI